MPDQVLHDEHQWNVFLNYDTISCAGMAALGYLTTNIRLHPFPVMTIISSIDQGLKGTPHPMPGNTTNTTSTGNRSVSTRQWQGVPASNGGFYEEIEHTADLALRFGGPDLESFFRSAARGMYHLMGAEGSLLNAADQKTVSLEAMDIESLLVDWLGELAYLVETTHLVFRDMTFKTLSTTRIEAVLTGRRAHRLDKVIKAVTYHHLNVKKTPEGYAATVVFDV